MVMTRIIGNLKLGAPLGKCLLAGVSSVALVSAVALVATGTVQADVRLRPSPTQNALEPVTSATPDFSLAAPEVGATQEGVASWYGGVFNGRTTASGEQYDMYEMTACHPTLPFGSLVRVENLLNHRSVVVKINDRGDLVRDDRIIDLSFGAAQQLKMIHNGLALVEVKVLRVGKQRVRE